MFNLLLFSVFLSQPVAALQVIASPVKSIVFDFGGVLAKPDQELIVSYLANYFGVQPEEIRELQLHELEWIRLTVKEFEFWTKFANDRGQELPSNWWATYQNVKLDSVREIPGIGDLLSELRERGYQIEILSNFEPWMEPLLDRLAYRDFFDRIYLSYQTKLEKPSEGAYLNVLQQSDHHSNQIIFIDDQKPNVVAAQKLGIDAVQFISVEQLRADLVRRSILN